jgi:hypothetical protein
MSWPAILGWAAVVGVTLAVFNGTLNLGVGQVRPNRRRRSPRRVSRNGRSSRSAAKGRSKKTSRSLLPPAPKTGWEWESSGWSAGRFFYEDFGWDSKTGELEVQEYVASRVGNDPSPRTRRLGKYRSSAAAKKAVNAYLAKKHEKHLKSLARKYGSLEAYKKAQAKKIAQRDAENAEWKRLKRNAA